MTEAHTAQTPQQARALLDPQTMSVLGAFAEPATPSEAARQLGQPANRTTYHVRRLLDLELLRGVPGPGKRTRYQVVARSFVVPYRLTAAADVSDTFAPFFRELEGRFTAAVRERAQELSQERLEGAFTLRLGEVTPFEADPPPAELLSYALIANIQTLSLSAEQYADFERDLGALFARYAAHGPAPERRVCTAVRLLFPGALYAAQTE
ncbi:helix-turn-helix transcriptional regulator [Deinococcus sp. SDU3-2]|uniref:Helix-turn-helix transcriptional regulator n=1 Tax=Deinococcus terrestris TaxID=2651870 RepID=A0A7X1NTB4_9DEIO|nr:helix-turn-helix domain-containing protein [Deinococcus terrestris]MPY65417.1 helix-turn-helix transcriptional regulator [Deinococcus terrestris]